MAEAGLDGWCRSGTMPRSDISAASVSGFAATHTATGWRLRISFLRMRTASSRDVTRKSTTPSRIACFWVPTSAVALRDAFPRCSLTAPGGSPDRPVLRQREACHPGRTPHRILLTGPYRAGRWPLLLIPGSSAGWGSLAWTDESVVLSLVGFATPRRKADRLALTSATLCSP